MSIIDIMKGISTGTYDGQTPVNLIPGTVTKVDPLEIYVHEKLTLTKDFIVIAEHLTRHERVVTTEHVELTKRDLGDGVGIDHLNTDDMVAPISQYKHSYIKLTFEDVLKKDDQVMLIRIQGGQQYYVADRAVNA